MRIKIVSASILAGAVFGVFSYCVFSDSATLAALAIRRKMPNAWFSGLIVWYAHFALIALSIVIAGIAFRMVYRYATRSVPTA